MSELFLALYVAGALLFLIFGILEYDSGYTQKDRRRGAWLVLTCLIWPLATGVWLAKGFKKLVETAMEEL